MRYSRQEQETSIVWDEEEKVAQIYTTSPVTIRKLDKLCDSFPADYRRTWTETDEEGRTTAARYQTYKGFVRFGKPRRVTDEQREAARERLNAYHAERQSN